MSYRLIAIKPEILYLDGKGTTVEVGDCLHLSNADGEALVNSPISGSFVVITKDDPTEVKKFTTFTEGSAIEKVVDEGEDSVLGAAVKDPVEEIYGEYKQDGEQFFEALRSDQNLQPGLNLESESSQQAPSIEGFDSELIRTLGETPSWKTLVNYVRELGNQPSPNLELINYIQQKYSSMGSVVNECKRVITQLQEKQIES
jgi:hypothetical protein